MWPQCLPIMVDVERPEQRGDSGFFSTKSELAEEGATKHSSDSFTAQQSLQQAASTNKLGNGWHTLRKPTCFAPFQENPLSSHSNSFEAFELLPQSLQKKIWEMSLPGGCSPNFSSFFHTCFGINTRRFTFPKSFTTSKTANVSGPLISIPELRS